MPVSTGPLGEPRAKRCKLCDESSHISDSGSGYWQLQLDRDLVDTISAIYPEWFRNNMAEGGGSPTSPRESPPKAIIDTSPIVIDQNKESLKVKLLLRRPFDQLVAQGIMPPHKTPAAYHGQRRQLERAKTGDMLKAKIQQRPPRQELERRHILEVDPSHVDPSLAERQRMLKKAKLADHLNDQLSHRPGPLELIQKNILHTEEPIEEAVKTGRIPYKATSEGQLHRPQLPSNYINPEEDSQSSEGDNRVSPGPSDVLETAAKSAGIVVSLMQPTETVAVTSSSPILKKDNNEVLFADLCRSVAAPLLSQASASSPASLVSSTSTLSPLSSVASPIMSQPATPAPPPPPPMSLITRAVQSPVRNDSVKDKNRKKSKTKSIPKTRTIKFHEYKGPPSAHKTTNNNTSPEESSYDLLLKQQTLLLQFQLQLQHKYPQIILPASQKSSSPSETNNNNHINIQQPSPAPSTSSESSTPSRITGRLEDMKVSDLKAELKRRSLPVSGSKPQLIERLKPFTGSNDIINQNPPSIDSSIHSNASMDQSHNSPVYQNIDSPQESIRDEKPEQMDLDPMSPSPQPIQEQFLQYKIQQALENPPQKTNEHDDIVREQQRQIEELQRELTLSQLKLQAATRTEPKAQMIALQKHLQARQQQQRLQQQQQQQLQQQQQQQQNFILQMKHLQALQARQTANEEQQRLQQQINLQNQKNITGGLILNTAEAALMFNQLLQGKTKVLNGQNRSNAFLNSIVTPIIAAPEIKTEYVEDNIPKEVKIELVEAAPKPPPPQYNEATKQMNKKNHIKSQIVDDVLEILIKNGELPPSAANDPLTPNSAGTKSTEPVYPAQNLDDNHNSTNLDPEGPEATLGIDPSDLLEALDNIENIDFSQLMELGGCQNQQENNNFSNDNTHEDIAMDTDDWLESLLPQENVYDGTNNAAFSSQEPDLGGYDPLLGIAQDPFDPFNLEEFRSPADLTASLSWDKIDYAA
ncbi:myocardin-related transcription factor B-like isoform X1 [Diorhabda carinulata]|uniref:myocardin-related transcription factor B-like isoform X1 n=2 Tax=Diorhabda carinulata TaxID=1163345 RepID=UPI0025A09661|nr:myocardin-related transcription factor B-like isoform X1 [Diorhabda carinulata]